jgi:hypothetical protein
MRQISYIPLGTRVYCIDDTFEVTLCTFCQNGKIIGKDNIEIECPVCHGTRSVSALDNTGGFIPKKIVKSFIIARIQIVITGTQNTIEYSGADPNSKVSFLPNIGRYAEDIYITEEEAINNLEA